MTPPPSHPQIVAAEKLEAGVIITFDDGKCAVYPASLLYATYTQAKPITDYPQMQIEESP